MIFYGNSTGAWKGAHLRKTNPKHYISKVYFNGHMSGKLDFKVEVEGTKKWKTHKILIEVIDPKTNVILASLKSNHLKNTIHVPGARLWSMDDPNLYHIDLKLFSDGAVVEKIRSYAGFSQFKQEYGHFYLNGKPVYLRGVLNQMVFPKGLYTPETQESNKHDLKMILDHGFNFQRFHNTTPRWRDIYEMEKMGIAWALEMPSARDLRNPIALNQFLDEWKEIIDAYGHGHANLFYFVPGNEDWGMLEDPDHWAPASDETRERFQLKLLATTLSAAPSGSLVSPGDGWRQITGIKNNSRIKGINPSQIILSAHDYSGSSEALMEKYFGISVNAPIGTKLPGNGKELILRDYDFAGCFIAPLMGEFGGKSFAPPGIGNAFGYGSVYRDINNWREDALDQLSTMGKLEIFRGGYVYTQVRDEGFRPHMPLPGNTPAGELNGFLFADGEAKSDPSKWKEVNLRNELLHEENRKKYLMAEGNTCNSP